ncbi:MAG: clostripain-related cysteine peptidase [Candidatus Xenobiia bacterium LiM19]
MIGSNMTATTLLTEQRIPGSVTSGQDFNHGKMAEKEEEITVRDFSVLTSSQGELQAEGTPGRADILQHCAGKNSQSDTAEAPMKKWTILFYSAADNNLLTYMFMDINETESVGSDENTSLVAQFDEGRRGASRYLLQKDSDFSAIHSPVLKKMGAIDMADPDTLADFVSWGVKNFPAEHYALIISDHGFGWEGAIEDDSHENIMTTPGINKGLEKAEKETGVKLDVLGFDACLMGSTEVAYELRDRAEFMVASEESEGAAGWSYTKVLSQNFLCNLQQSLGDRINITPLDFAKKIVDDAALTPGALPTMSALDLSKMGSLKDALNTMAEKMISTDTSSNTINNLAGASQSFFVFKDLCDFCHRIDESGDVRDEELRKSAQAVMDCLKKQVVIGEQHSEKYPDAHGLHIELHSWQHPGDVEWSRYGDLAFARDTEWLTALKKLYNEQ